MPFNAYMGIYQGTVTAGGQDGNRVSEDPDDNAPISVTLNASTNEVSGNIKLAIRCLNANHRTVGNTVIQLTGTTAAKWQLAPDNGSGSPGVWSADGGSITISSVIDNTNTIFWAKAKATSDEGPQNNTSVNIQVTATVEAY
jgi:hypothetical protein